MTKVEDKIEEIELTPEALKAISDNVTGEILPTVTEAIEKALEGNAATVKEAVEAVLEARKKEDEEAADTPEAKKLAAAKAAKAAAELDADPIAKGLADGTIDKEISEMSAAKRFYAQVKALTNEEGADLKTLRKINRYNLATQQKARAEAAKKGENVLAKTGYANSTTAADGAVLIPDAEFVTTVFDNLPKYGVAFSDADVRQTDRTSVRVISLDSGLTFYKTGEGVAKTSAKLQFSKNEVPLFKYAVIVPAADEFSDDAAVDYWNLVTRELSRAYAKLADQIVFTDEKTGSGTSEYGGIINLTGVLTQTIGAGLDWGDLLAAQGKTEDDLDESNNKWYMRKETWYTLIGLKGTTNDHFISGSLNTSTGWVANPNQPTTPWGTPVKFTRVLPGINTVQANDGIAVYGDLSNYILYNKRGMMLKMLTEATIHDADNSAVNLAEQDISAMRAVVRLLGICPKGNRGKFVVMGTGTVS